MNKRGQFYLIAAIIIVAVAVGFIIVSNSVSSQQNPNIYYLRDEIKIESSKVIDYAASSQLSGSQISSDLADLSNRYINNSQDENFYFAFGNTTGITFIAYEAFHSNITLNGNDYTNTINVGSTYETSFVPATNYILFGINGNLYNYTLNPGENFDFVLSSNSGGQNYTAAS